MEDGRVRTGARNFYTNSDKKVTSSLFKHYSYSIDPYERGKQLERERLKMARAKEAE